MQYLDLSRVSEGVIRRDERFGYVELATAGYTTPCLTPGPVASERSRPPAFIHVWRYEGETKVRFEVEMTFDLNTGKPEDWERRGIKNFD